VEARGAILDCQIKKKIESTGTCFQIQFDCFRFRFPDLQIDCRPIRHPGGGPRDHKQHYAKPAKLNHLYIAQVENRQEIQSEGSNQKKIQHSTRPHPAPAKIPEPVLNDPDASPDSLSREGWRLRACTASDIADKICESASPWLTGDAAILDAQDPFHGDWPHWN
jgi:hypothetical protein